MPFRYSIATLPLLGGLWFAAVEDGPPLSGSARARLDVRWMVERGDHTYRLHGRYTVSSVAGDFTANIASDASPDLDESHIELPTGLYRVTLEPGYTLERTPVHSESEASLGVIAGAGVEVVPASLVSPNPLLLVVESGRVPPIGLTLIDMPGTGDEPASTCSTST